jgi:hypothetical protein
MLTGVIAELARSSHRNTFDRTVHMKFSILQQLNQTKKACSGA